MKILLIPTKNNTKRIQTVVSNSGYDSKIVENVNTLVGIKSGIMVEIKDVQELLIICNGFTNKEKTYEIGITKLKE